MHYARLFYCGSQIFLTYNFWWWGNKNKILFSPFTELILKAGE
jgi:hypothetical protein